MSLLNPNSNTFHQAPKRRVDVDDTQWYSRRLVRVKVIVNMMKDISTNAGLNREIYKITGHKTNESMKSYSNDWNLSKIEVSCHCPLLLDEGRRALTCKDIHNLSTKFAAILQRRGLKHGDVVCNTLTNSPERLITDFGIMAAGCVAANAQALLGDGTDLLHVINLSRCRLLIGDNSQPGSAWDLLKPHLGKIMDLKVKSINAPKLEMVEFVGVKGGGDYLEMLHQEGDPVPVEILPTDTALYWATSGSTGFSKLVPKTHEAMLLLASRFTEMFRIHNENDVLYNDRPLGWAAFMKKLAERRNKENSDDVIQRLMCLASGQPFAGNCFEFVGKICHSVANGYGMTEVGYVSSCICEKEEDFEDNLVGCNSHLGVKVVDEQLKDLGAGKDGQVLLHGQCVFKGYINNPEATKAAFTDDGWFKTDDVGHFDEKGRLFVEGRRSDAIMHGEYIIYPSWVEKKLRTCPYISEVMVVPVPHPDMCHEVCACVIPKPNMDVTTKMIKDYCDPIFISDSLHEMSAKPAYYVLFESFPLRPTGKPDRRALSEIADKMTSVSL
ncbi:3-[(3aS,4S,7aS)-7a-methyl-1,5-dioxo-octahydro-1H-inden-4-yl]propanoyl:CoA ligase-like [Haliotis rufescens]|uniref:3-[(3aS,4S,7aS)-7a-methyl-1, 5-dioxo-octahydro-1H-inden-4-yl]propanoyl:CoA ligase-like n=1 Tax=Haliotis rufescens TaxID=6454 RepID=UPI00201F1161|nr:3-[(3aS,4S,7aS)-7a-methyl-1,5-dioxo-octahydro-1H-inden-4-yl]propanoyl:CoA ligase-like [Haliotis rufescens]